MIIIILALELLAAQPLLPAILEGRKVVGHGKFRFISWADQGSPRCDLHLIAVATPGHFTMTASHVPTTPPHHSIHIHTYWAESTSSSHTPLLYYPPRQQSVCTLMLKPCLHLSSFF